MKGFNKYKKQYFAPEAPEMSWTKKEYIDKPPAWCSVDLRDGNQALIIPMSLEEKLEFLSFFATSDLKRLRWDSLRQARRNTNSAVP